MIKLKDILNETFSAGEDDIDEYDVENEQDIKEFVEFIREYQQTLNEADCDCLLEAKYRGRTVPLGKPMQGDVKKFKVYVKNPKTGKVVKVNFGAKGMNIKKITQPDAKHSELDIIAITQDHVLKLDIGLVENGN